MSASDRLLGFIRSTPEAGEPLRSFGFDVWRKENGEGSGLVSGEALEPIAGEFAGGAYFLGVEVKGRRPVVFASSEGECGLIADDLPGALGIIIGLQWQDCLGFSGGGDLEVMQVSARHLERKSIEDRPEIVEERARLLGVLSLPQVPVADLVVRLWEAVSRTEAAYVVADGAGQEYGPMFGESSEPRFGGWG
ncbi:hypothetical protein AB0I28_08965 [Phytomonospora sp. NPDC050363]|uniref:hypothetical protein n=1 Tax=Phytomonospora sp. NPDC050363 TaxID=3155642 RepID=UPI0033DDEAFF